MYIDFTSHIALIELARRYTPDEWHLDDDSFSFELNVLSEEVTLSDCSEAISVLNAALHKEMPNVLEYDLHGTHWIELQFGDRYGAFFLAVCWSTWNPADCED